MAKIGRTRLHRRHHLQAEAQALERIGDRDGELAMPCSRIIGVVRFADDGALPSLPDFGEQGEMTGTARLRHAFGSDQGEVGTRAHEALVARHRGQAGEINRQVLDIGYAGGPDADHALRFGQFDRLDDGSRKQQ